MINQGHTANDSRHPQHHHQQEFQSSHLHNSSWHHQQMMNQAQHQQVIMRNSAQPPVRNTEHFLEAGLPSVGGYPVEAGITTKGNYPGDIDLQQQPRRSVSRPTSRGPSHGDNRKDSRDSLKDRSMTLPARMRTSQGSLMMESFDSDNSPRTRTSKSGLHEDSEPVPASPGAQQNNNISNPSLSSHKDFTSHQNYRGTD